MAVPETFLDFCVTWVINFIGYLRYKSVETKTETPHNSFLLSIVGLGASTEKDVSEKDEEVLTNEVNPICGWSLH